MERYEEWDVAMPPLPSRSRLYRLEPIGIGTPYVESLTSYIARLAKEHSVSPGALASQEIMPLQRMLYMDPKYGYTSRLESHASHTLNGRTTMARQWVETLQALTARSDLRFLTLLTWEQVIAGRALRENKAWCSRCYEELRQSNQIIYEPLLWAFRKVEICIKHQCPLILLCPRCQRPQWFLSLSETHTAIPGYCLHCRCWLGCEHKPRSIDFASIIIGGIEQKLWIGESVGNLLAVAPKLRTEPYQEQIAKMLSLCVEKYARGYMSALARLLNVPKVTLLGYIQNGRVPHFDSLLHFCRTLSITPLEFLTASNILPQRIPQFSIDHVLPLSRSKGQPLSEEDVQFIRNTIEAILKEDMDPFPSLEKLARRLGCYYETLQEHCPDLCQAVIARSRQHWPDDVHERVKQALLDELISDQPKPLAKVARQLDCDIQTLRYHFPDLCQAIFTRYYQRIDYEQIRQRLHEMLASTGAILSVAEFARKEGCSPFILKTRFPDEYKQMVNLRRIAGRSRRDGRIADGCREVWQATLWLHQQGIYPSAKRLLRHLSNPHIIREKEIYETWRRMLKELGYPTDMSDREE